MKNLSDWMCLGLYVGKTLFDRVPLIVGLPKKTSNQQLKHLVASVGPPFAKIPLVHVLGVTPEAQTIEAAFHGKVPQDPETIVVGRKHLREARDTVSNVGSGTVDLVSLGCPQYSLEELKEVAHALSGKRVHPHVQLWVWTDRATRTAAKAEGLVDTVEQAGGHVLADSCTVVCALDHSGYSFETMATDNVKTAGFMIKEGKFHTYLGDVLECIEAAVTGRWGGN
jgi:predicted aconitase